MRAGRVDARGGRVPAGAGRGAAGGARPRPRRPPRRGPRARAPRSASARGRRPTRPRGARRASCAPRRGRARAASPASCGTNAARASASSGAMPFATRAAAVSERDVPGIGWTTTRERMVGGRRRGRVAVRRKRVFVGGSSRIFRSALNAAASVRSTSRKTMARMRRLVGEARGIGGDGPHERRRDRRLLRVALLERRACSRGAASRGGDHEVGMLPAEDADARARRLGVEAAAADGGGRLVEGEPPRGAPSPGPRGGRRARRSSCASGGREEEKTEDFLRVKERRSRPGARRRSRRTASAPCGLDAGRRPSLFHGNLCLPLRICRTTRRVASRRARARRRPGRSKRYVRSGSRRHHRAWSSSTAFSPSPRPAPW